MKKKTVEECERLSIVELKKNGALTNYELGDYLDGFLPLTQTNCSFGGRRWWFLCPNCRTKVGVLYKPRDSDFFLCRRCHDLTYESSQESHKFDALYRAINIKEKQARRIFKKRRTP